MTFACFLFSLELTPNHESAPSVRARLGKSDNGACLCVYSCVYMLKLLSVMTAHVNTYSLGDESDHGYLDNRLEL